MVVIFADDFGYEVSVGGSGRVRWGLASQCGIVGARCDMSRKNVVLLGIGHTNAHVVKQWVRHPIPDCNLVCVSNFATATYSGMLPGTLARQFDEQEMRIDLRRLADRARAELILADVCGLDLDTSRLEFSDRVPLAFDSLSIGIGSVPIGWREHASSDILIPIKPMQTFLDRLRKRLDRVANRPPRVAIVGGGVAGVEIAFCLREYCRQRSPSGIFSIDVFTSRDRVADGMSVRSQRRVESLFAERAINVVAGHRVVQVGDSFLRTRDDTRHAADCVIWCTGAAPPPVLGRFGLQTDERGFIATKTTLQTLTDSRVFAVGDSGTVLHHPSPKAGVYAVRQAPVLWHNLRAAMTDTPMREFRPQKDFLKILNTGDGKAILEFKGLSVYARWCMRLKNWIDKRFIRPFQVQYSED